jgi:hypothetical protein
MSKMIQLRFESGGLFVSQLADTREIPRCA